MKPYILKKKKKKKVPKQAAGLFGNLLKPDQVSENLDNLPKVHPVNDDE